KFYGQLVNLIEYRLRGLHEGIPLSTFHIHLEDQVTSSVAVSVNLSRRRVEHASIGIGRARAGDTFRVKHQRASVTHRLLQIEAVVLVNFHLQLTRNIATPSVVPGDAVRI